MARPTATKRVQFRTRSGKVVSFRVRVSRRVRRKRVKRGVW